MLVIHSTNGFEPYYELGPVQGMEVEMGRTIPSRGSQTCCLDQDTKHRLSEHG